MSATKTTHKRIQEYLPVIHEDGRELVQVTDSEGNLVGWTHCEKWDVTGSWTVADCWTAAQNASYARAIGVFKSVGMNVTIEHRGLARRVTACF